VKKQSW